MKVLCLCVACHEKYFCVLSVMNNLCVCMLLVMKNICVCVACYELPQEKHITTSYGRTLHRSMFALKICYSPIPNPLTATLRHPSQTVFFFKIMVDFKMCINQELKYYFTKTALNELGHWNAAKLNIILTSSESQCFCTISIPEEMLEVVTAGLKRALCKVVSKKKKENNNKKLNKNKNNNNNNSNLEGCPVCQQVRE